MLLPRVLELLVGSVGGSGDEQQGNDDMLHFGLPWQWAYFESLGRRRYILADIIGNKRELVGADYPA